jgi:putative hydrolase of the HAD superfamily
MTSDSSPAAVLLDAGGVFVLPEPARIVAAFGRAECEVEAGRLADAHYRAATRFSVDLDVEADWNGSWLGYLATYIEECGVHPDRRAEAHRHIDSEFADAALWVEEVPGSRAGLEALARAGVRLGIVSNADGLMGRRLAAMEICQVGPGLGVSLECLIDSGDVGVMKPDRRIFDAALALLELDAGDVWYVGDMPAIDVVGARRAGLHPILMDPLELHLDAGYDRVGSLEELAARIVSARSGWEPGMHPDQEFSLASARQAADDDRLADWVTAFLASPGSSNEPLAGALAFEGATYLGPLELELDRLRPMAGPDGEEVVVPIAEEEWEDEVGAMAESLDQGWEPPPLLVSCRSDGLYLEDGNHRHESLRRHGATHAWAIIVFAGDADRRVYEETIAPGRPPR